MITTLEQEVFTFDGGGLPSGLQARIATLDKPCVANINYEVELLVGATTQDGEWNSASTRGEANIREFLDYLSVRRPEDAKGQKVIAYIKGQHIYAITREAQVLVKQRNTILASFLDRMKQGEKLYLKDLDDAIASAVDSDHPTRLNDLSAEDRCALMLEGHISYLKEKGKENPVSQTYESFAVIVGKHSSDEPTYRVWRPVLDKFQASHELKMVDWFKPDKKRTSKQS